ncbi:streptococcin A-M57, partial [Enterococcus gallinarum]
LTCSVLAISTSLLPFTNVFASESINTDISNISETNISSHEVDQVAQALESMFDNKVSTFNFKEYVNNNFSDSEIAIAESELESRISNSRPEFRVAWNEMGGCIAGKIRDEFFAMISVGTIVKYAQ